MMPESRACASSLMLQSIKILKFHRILGLILLSTAFILVTPLEAQLVVEEDDDDSEVSPFEEYWDKHFNFRLGLTSAIGIGVDSYRNYHFMNLKWDHDFDWISFKFEAEGYHRDFRYVLKISSGEERRLMDEITVKEVEISNESDADVKLILEDELADLQDKFDSTPKEIIFNSKESTAIYREANVKLSPHDSVQLSLGYHTIVWGQVNVFSPVDILLPLRFASGSVGLSKANSRLPQKSAILTIFPIPQIEIQGYYFPDITLDSSLVKYFEGNVVELEQTTAAEQTTLQNNVNFGFEYPEKDDAPQYATRILFYLDWATIGLVYFDGWDQIILDDNATIKQVTYTDDMNTPDDARDDINLDVYRISEEPRMSRTHNYGIETNFDLDGWTLAIDIVQRELPETIDLELLIHNDIITGETNLDDPGITIGPSSINANNARETLINFALTEKNGSLAYKQEQTLWAVELSSDSEDWFLAYGIFGVETRDTENKDLADLDRARDEIESLDSANDELSVAPFVNVSRYLSDNKTDAVGFAFGYLGFGFGLTCYWVQEYYESLQVGVSLEYFGLMSSQEASDAFEGYELENDAFAALRLLVSYKL